MVLPGERNHRVTALLLEHSCPLQNPGQWLAAPQECPVAETTPRGAPHPWLPPPLPPVPIFSPSRTVAWDLPLQGPASGQSEPLGIINMVTRGLRGFQGPKKSEAWKRYDWLHNTKKKTATLTSVNISLNAKCNIMSTPLTVEFNRHKNFIMFDDNL